MAANANPLRALIGDALDRLERHGLAVTPKNVRANITVDDLTLRDLHDAMTRQLNALIPVVMKERAMVIVNPVTRERKPFWTAGPDDLEQQLKIKTEGSGYDRKRIAADKAVIAFLREKSTELGYEVYPELFQDEIDRIFRMQNVTPPSRKAGA